MSDEISDMITRYKQLQVRKGTLDSNKVKIEAELAVRRRSLKEALDQCRELGLDPDDLDKQIKALKEVITVKLDLFEADLKTAEEQIKPMLAEIS